MISYVYLTLNSLPGCLNTNKVLTTLGQRARDVRARTSSVLFGVETVT